LQYARLESDVELGSRLIYMYSSGRHACSVSICTFVPGKQVNLSWRAPCLPRRRVRPQRQYLYLCSSKARKASKVQEPELAGALPTAAPCRCCCLYKRSSFGAASPACVGIAEEGLWNKRPNGIGLKRPTETKSGSFIILEFKRMSDVTDQYILRARQAVEEQYSSLRTALSTTLQHQGWVVKQVSFIAGARSLNEEDLRKNLRRGKSSKSPTEQASTQSDRN